MSDGNVITEEIDVGNLSTSGSAGSPSSTELGTIPVSSSSVGGEEVSIPSIGGEAPVEGINTGEVGVAGGLVGAGEPTLYSNEEVVTNVGGINPSYNVVQSPTAVIPQPSTPRPGAAGGVSRLPTMDDLNRVSTITKDETCKTLEEIAAATGLDVGTVQTCIDYLDSQGLVSKNAKMYCGIAAVKNMMQQLSGCRDCFKTAGG